MLRLNSRNLLLSTCAATALTLGVSYEAQAQTAIDGGGSTLAGPVYMSIFQNLTGQVDPTVAFQYASVGSGAGSRGVLCDDGSQVAVNGVSPATVHYGASDNLLSQQQVTNWDASLNVQSGGGSGCATASNGTIGKAQGGPLIQVATIGTPVTIVYNNPRQFSNGGLTFTANQLCGIFSAKITSWTDSALSGIATKNAPTGPITVVYRSDGSGTSALFTSYLNKVCNSTNSNVSFTSTQTFAQLFGASIPTNFIGASGSGQVAASIGLDAAQTGGAVTGTSGSIGYISPDYTQIASIHKGGAYPPVAKLVDSSNNAVLPDYANTVAALNQAPLPTGSALQDGTKYVPVIAYPPAGGYPIVGYTTWILPTCFQDNNVVNGIIEFLSLIYTEPDYVSLIQQQGFVQLPEPLVAIINANILNNGNSFNIDIQDPTICQGGGASGPGTYVGR